MKLFHPRIFWLGWINKAVVRVASNTRHPSCSNWLIKWISSCNKAQLKAKSCESLLTLEVSFYAIHAGAILSTSYRSNSTLFYTLHGKAIGHSIISLLNFILEGLQLLNVILSIKLYPKFEIIKIIFNWTFTC